MSREEAGTAEPPKGGRPPSESAIRSSAIRHLPFFIAVAEDGSFQKAANRLNVVQPALSRRIQELERTLGVRLFDRLPRGVRLSQAGRLLLEDGQSAMERFERGCARARKVGRGEVGGLRIGLTDTALGSPSVSHAITAFRESHPSIQLQILPAVSQDQLDFIRNEEVELALLFLNPDEAADLERVTLLSERFLLVLRSDHPLAAKTELSAADLAGEMLIWPRRAWARNYWDRMYAEFRRLDINPHIAADVMNVDQLFSMVENDLGIGFINESKQHMMPDGLVLRRVTELHIDMDFCMVWPVGNVAQAAAEFMSIVRQAFGK